MFLFLLIVIVAVVLYIKSSKNSKQQTDGNIMVAKIHWMTLVPAVIYTLIGLFVFSFLDNFFMELLVTFVVGMLLSAFTRMPLYDSWVKYFTTKLSVTPTRLVGKTGLINVKRVDFPTEQISSVTIESTFWGQILNYSDITINTSGGEQTFEMIGNAVEFQRYCLDVKDRKDDIHIQKQADALKEAFSAALKDNQQQIIPANNLPASKGKLAYCSACGAKVSAGAVFCNACGSKLN